MSSLSSTSSEATITTIETIEYVSFGDTLADIALKDQQSVGLTDTSSILLSILVMITFIMNTMLLATILSSYKLRNCLLYLMFCSIIVLNLIDVFLIMFLSILYVANGNWTFGNFLCRLNALAQQFIFLKELLGIMLMAMERALGLLGRHLVTQKFFGILTLIFTLISISFAMPLFLPSFPVNVYRFRYLCAIGSGSPIVYSIVQILIYGGCLFVLLLCFGSLLRYRSHQNRQLPVKPQDYGAFIIESRALHDQLALARLVLFMTICYILIQGPYICLSLFVQIRNSAELLASQNNEMILPQDADTLITWIRFFYPLLIPILILSNCHDIWTKFVNLLFCRRNTSATTFGGAYGIPGKSNKNNMFSEHNNVLTLVATADGLQLRVPNNNNNQIHPLYNTSNLYPKQQKLHVQKLSQPLPQVAQHEHTIQTNSQQTIIQQNRINSRNSIKEDIQNDTPETLSTRSSTSLEEEVEEKPFDTESLKNFHNVGKWTAGNALIQRVPPIMASLKNPQRLEKEKLKPPKYP